MYWAKHRFLSAFLRGILLFLILGCSAIASAKSYTNCFVAGEVSEYKVSWLKLPLAWSKTTTEACEENGRKLIRLRMVSKNYKAYNHIYKVNDVTEVIVDPQTALPVRLDFVLNEGGRHKSHLTRFDHTKGEAVYIDRLANTTNTVKIAKDTRDVVTFLYASRNWDLEALTKDTHQIYVDGKVNKMGMKLGKKKKLKIPGLGKVECVQLEPIADFDGLFLRQGRIFFWVSKTKHRMITLTEAKVPVGKIKVRLHKVSGTGNKFWDKKK